MGPPNNPISWTFTSTVRHKNGTVLDENTFDFNGEHRPNTITQFNPGLLNLDEFPDSGTWEICGSPNFAREGWAAVTMQEINDKTKIGAAYHEVVSPADKCLADQNTACLGPGGKFQAEMTAGDPPQSVQAIPSGDYFFFFDPDNVEVIVKVLDACNLPGFNNSWVFAAGLTNVEVTLTVTDTQTNQTKQYTDPFAAAEPITDTSAWRPPPRSSLAESPSRRRS